MAHDSTWRVGTRSATGRHATWLELFFDLVFVVTVAQLTHYLVKHPDPSGLATVMLLFYPVFVMWAAHMMYSTRFELDDAVTNVLTLVMMAAALVYAIGVHDGLAGSAWLIIGPYLTCRLVIWALWARTTGFRWLSDTPRGVAVDLLGYADLVIWFSSAFVPQPWQQAMWLGAFLLQGVQTYIVWDTGAFTQAKADNSHVPERFGLFIIIAMGESLLALATALLDTVWTLPAIAAAAAGFVLVASLWWIYFGFVESHILGKAEIGQGVLHQYMHYGLIIGLVALATGIHLGVAAHGHGAVAPLLGLGLGAFVLFIHVLDVFEARRTLASADHVRAGIGLVGALVLGLFGSMLPDQALLVLTAGLFAVYAARSHAAREGRHARPAAAAHA